MKYWCPIKGNLLLKESSFSGEADLKTSGLAISDCEVSVLKMAAIHQTIRCLTFGEQAKNLGNFLKFVWCMSNFFWESIMCFSHQKKITNRTSFHNSTCTFSPLPTPGPSQSSPLHDPCSCSPRSLWRPGHANTRGKGIPGNPGNGTAILPKIRPNETAPQQRRGSLIFQVHSNFQGQTCLLFVVRSGYISKSLGGWSSWSPKLPKKKSCRRNFRWVFFSFWKRVSSHLKRWGHPILAADIRQNVTSLSSLNFQVCRKLCLWILCAHFGVVLKNHPNNRTSNY